MLLAIDIGNTNIVIGCIQNDEILFEARIRTDATKTSDEYCVDIKNILDIYGLAGIFQADIKAGFKTRANNQASLAGQLFYSGLQRVQYLRYNRCNNAAFNILLIDMINIFFFEILNRVILEFFLRFSHRGNYLSRRYPRP